MDQPDRSLDLRPLLALITVPLVSLGAAAAHYGWRSEVVPHLSTRLGWSMEQSIELYGYGMWATVAGAILAGAIGAGIGGWSTLVLGLALTAVSLVGLAGFEDPTLPFLLSNAGRGMVIVGMATTLAVALRGRRNWLLVAGLGLAYLMTNLAGLGAPAAASNMSQAAGSVSVFFMTSALVGVTALTAAGAGIAWHLLGRRTAKSTIEDPPANVRLYAVSAAVLLLAIGAAPLYQWSLELNFVASNNILSNWTFSTFEPRYLNPIVVVAMAALTALVCFALHFFRVRSRSVAIGGVGATIVGGSLALVLVANALQTPNTEWLVVLGVVGTAVAEVLFWNFTIAGIARGVHWRLFAPIIALFYAIPIAIYGVIPAQDDFIGAGTQYGLPIGAWLLPPGLIVLGALLIVSGLLFAKVWEPTPKAQY